MDDTKTTAVQRTVLITGATSGIGLASALRMKRAGWRVLATARHAEGALRLARDHGLEAVILELADPTSIAACADRALDMTCGHVNALFNNAAYGQIGAVEDVTVEDLRRQFEVNLFGAHDLTRRLIPAMRKAGWGRVVQCSSVLGLVSGPYRGAYSASKFALEGLSDAMRIELKDANIAVSLIEPGPIRTRFIEHALENFRRTIDWEASPHAATYRARMAKLEAGGNDGFKLEPDAVADKLEHALTSPHPKPRYFVTTPTYLADAMRRLLPTAALDRVVKSQ